MLRRRCGSPKGRAPWTGRDKQSHPHPLKSDCHASLAMTDKYSPSPLPSPLGERVKRKGGVLRPRLFQFSNRPDYERKKWSLDKAGDEENRSRTLCGTSRIFRGAQRSIKPFIAFVSILRDVHLLHLASDHVDYPFSYVRHPVRYPLDIVRGPDEVCRFLY